MTPDREMAAPAPEDARAAEPPEAPEEEPAEDRLSRKEAAFVMRRLAGLARPYALRIAGVLAMVAVVAVLTIVGPLLAGSAVQVLQAPKGRHVDITRLDVIVAVFLGVVAVGAVLGRQQVRSMAAVGEQVLADLRVKLFTHLQELSLAFYETQPTGKLVARMTSDFDAMEDLVQQGLVVFVQNALVLAAAMVILPIYSLSLFGLVFVTLPPLVALTTWFQRASKGAFLTVRDRISQTLTTLQEGIAGVAVIQAFGREDATVRRFGRQNQAQLDANLHAVAISIRYFPILEATGIVTSGALLGVGGLLVAHHLADLGKVVAFVLALGLLYSPIQQIGQLFQQVQSTGAALAKVFGILDTQTTVPEPAHPLALQHGGTLDLRGVSFRYGPGLPLALDGVDLSIAPGERVALVGATGAGKSTLAKILARFYDPVAGSVTLGGVDLRDVSLETLRERVVVVPQEGFLFAGSIADNVRFGRPGASGEDVRRAIGAIGALERFEAFPDGLDTEVQERGSQLSAGERQLVSLARAALVAPEVLVLDEATSNLDPGTEVVIENAMEALREGRTVVVIAHRLSTAQRADRIAVVDGGRVIELGSHRELLRSGGAYAEMYAAWEAKVA